MKQKQATQFLKQLKKNNTLYEAIYTAVVSNNDYIKELKSEIKDYKKDLKQNKIYISLEYMHSHIETLSEILKESKKRRKDLQKACFILFDDNLNDYSD